jgi:hypothetical protein
MQQGRGLYQRRIFQPLATECQAELRHANVTFFFFSYPG